MYEELLVRLQKIFTAYKELDVVGKAKLWAAIAAIIGALVSFLPTQVNGGDDIHTSGDKSPAIKSGGDVNIDYSGNGEQRDNKSSSAKNKTHKNTNDTGESVPSKDDESQEEANQPTN